MIPTDGADEALILCALLALSPGDRAYARRPHYAMFENATRLAGGVLSDDPDRRTADLDLHPAQPDRRGHARGGGWSAATGWW